MLVVIGIISQGIEYNKRNIFLHNHAENEAGRLVADLFLFFKKALKVQYVNLKISLNVRVHIKMIPWKVRILNPKNSQVICP